MDTRPALLFADGHVTRDFVESHFVTRNPSYGQKERASPVIFE